MADTSIIAKYTESMASMLGAKGTKHISEAGRTIRQGGESLLLGGALGAIHGTVGLDQKGVPVDGLAAVVGLGAAMAFPDHAYVDEARNAGSVALGIFGFRKTAEMVAKRRGAAKISGDDIGADDVGADVGADEDPLVKAARAL